MLQKQQEETENLLYLTTTSLSYVRVLFARVHAEFLRLLGGDLYYIHLNRKESDPSSFSLRANEMSEQLAW